MSVSFKLFLLLIIAFVTRTDLVSIVVQNGSGKFISLKWHLGKLCSHYGGCAMTVTVQGYLQRTLQLFLFMIAQVFGSDQNLLKRTLYDKCHSKAPPVATNIPKVQF